MKNYWRVMLGKKSSYAKECYEGGFFGADYDIQMDLGDKLDQEQRDFNKEMIPVYLGILPEKSKVQAGVSCSFLYTISRGIKAGDIIISPNGKRQYFVGEVKGNYSYVEGEILPHRRQVEWHNTLIELSELSEPFQNSVGAMGSVCKITQYSQEVDNYIEDKTESVIRTTDETIEDPTVFALEKHLEDFLVQNWPQTTLSQKYDLLYEDNELVGQQYPTDTGYIDLLAVSKDNKELLVIELKKGRASDVVVGQIQRYMGYILEEIAEDDQTVRGLIIALEDDNKLRRALVVTNNIDFYRYKVSFELFKN